ncbi:ABC-three component system protein [Empedobacter sp. UBA7620]|uniref:ABC-three component system protein n=1 Tax=Empedobacter sp. UBA7620 TaxID=1946452 RepID=UPI0025C68824|nr:ABC-three component system protein [Empedobacter sp. UBA7620]
MTKSRIIQEQHTAGPQAIGFDYQFYYFMFLALDLKFGQKIGFEVKDDIHIDKDDGKTTLYQAKHTIIKNSKGNPQNLTDLDIDLWKTLSNWVDFIKADNTSGFINKQNFILVTNKSENNNDFIDSLKIFKEDNDFDKVKSKINELSNKTLDKTLKKYIKNVSKLNKTKLSQFLHKLTIETGEDEIIDKIKKRIYEKYYQENLVEPIFNNLSSELNLSKYLDIKAGQKFEISGDEFGKRFGKCFKIVTELKPLPKRNLPILLPDDLESQIFIKQLIDIGEIQSGSNYIREYTTHMLKFLNEFSYWSDENFVLPTDIEEFKRNSIQIWINEFRSKYRQIERQINNGSSIENLEEDIKNLGIEIVDYIRKQDLSIQGFSALGIEFSNGYYYTLSDNLELGWHFDWNNKYKKE